LVLEILAERGRPLVAEQILKLQVATTARREAVAIDFAQRTDFCIPVLAADPAIYVSMTTIQPRLTM
jgi:hypothetical protein